MSSPTIESCTNKAGQGGAVRLNQLRTGERARLHAANLCCDDCELLNAMGLTERCELRICRIGEPCIVQVNGTRLGISATLAQEILVERV